MVDQVVIVSVIELLIGVIATALAYISWQYRDRPSGTPLMVMAAAIACWAFANGLHSLAPGETMTHLFSQLTYIFSLITVIGAFYVAVEYTETRSLKRRGIFIALVAFFILDATVIVTDPFHELFMTEEAGVTEDGVFEEVVGPFYWVHIGVQFGIALVALGLIGRAFRQARGVYRKQTAAIMVGGLVAIAFTFFQLLFPELLPAFSFNMAGMTVFSGMLLWAIFQADFLETVPVARELLVENMDDAVVALNTQDRVVDLNPRAMALLSVDTNVIGAPVTVAFEQYPELIEQFETTYEADTELQLDRDGNTHHYDINISPVIPNTEDEVTEETLLGRIIVIRDITEKVRRQQQLEAQKRELERQNERLDRFASVISHDLRNPLNTAQGYLDLARQTTEDEHFEKVEKSHDRMQTMIEELLTLARAETDIKDTETIVLDSLVTDAWELAETDGATLTSDISDGWTIEGDHNLLRNVFENLFRNATDHNEPPVTVRVGILKAEDGTEQGFYIEDDGEGIPEDKRDDIFDHGFTTDREGTGFGLSIVKELITAHGWEITVTDGTDGGARFEVTGIKTTSSETTGRNYVKK